MPLKANCSVSAPRHACLPACLHGARSPSHWCFQIPKFESLLEMLVKAAQDSEKEPEVVSKVQLIAAHDALLHELNVLREQVVIEYTMQ